MSPEARGVMPPFSHQVAFILWGFLALLIVGPSFAKLIDEYAALKRAEREALLLINCRIPIEHEVLLINVSVREGRLVGSCVPIGSRGSYARERK